MIEQRERGVAQRGGGEDDQRRRVQPSSGVDVGRLIGRLPSSVRASRRSACAARRPRCAGSSGIVWLPAAVWTTTVESPKHCSKTPAPGVDVLDAHPRDERAVDRERPVLDVDALVVDVPAPARPAQPRHARRRTDAEHAAATSRRPRPAPATARPRSRPRSVTRSPRTASCARHQTRRRDGREASRRRGLMPARRRGARSARARARTRRRTAACVTGASLAPSSRRTCARCAFTRSCAASAARTAPSRRGVPSRVAAAAWSRRRRRSAPATSRS